MWRVDVQLKPGEFDAIRGSECGGSDVLRDFNPEWKNFKLPIGANGQSITIGELMDHTPAQNMYKWPVEVKLFTTWYNARTVLMGDGKLLF
jgi:hypothetical protein